MPKVSTTSTTQFNIEIEDVISSVEVSTSAYSSSLKFNLNSRDHVAIDFGEHRGKLLQFLEMIIDATLRVDESDTYNYHTTYPSSDYRRLNEIVEALQIAERVEEAGVSGLSAVDTDRM